MSFCVGKYFMDNYGIVPLIAFSVLLLAQSSSRKLCVTRREGASYRSCCRRGTGGLDPSLAFRCGFPIVRLVVVLYV